MSQFKLLYDQNKKLWFVTCNNNSIEYNLLNISVNHLVNPKNREKWLKKTLTLHIEMEEWLRNEHPEFFI